MAAIPNITSWLTVFSLQTCNLSNGDEREKMACILIEKNSFQQCFICLVFLGTVKLNGVLRFILPCNFKIFFQGYISSTLF